ncbi:MAG: glycosyltransferase family 2 protein [Pseudomonadota bacterium]
MSAVPATATIIAKNEASNIAACVRSVAFFAEVLVIDSGSTDDTVAIARSAGANVVENAWPGYGPQKQFALERASHNWVFSLDADERVSAELQDAIKALFAKGPSASGYAVNRCNHFMGRALRHGEGYPDWCLRLFNREQGSWSLDPVHERVMLDGKIDRLKGDLDHYSEGSISEYLEKQNNYTTLQARHLYTVGRRASIAKLITSPFVRFIKFYFFRLGFLDGIPGLVHIVIGCFNSFCKYAKLRELQTRNACQ